MKKLNILFRTRVLVNTDPQRRCYNGAHAKSELQWTEWGVLEYEVPEDQIERRLEFWRSLNDYAVSQRGERARRECKAEPMEAPNANP